MLIKEDSLNLFHSKYFDEIVKYKERLEKIFEDYDVVVFMARKAICFYKSLVINNEIKKPISCEIISSRALNYNISEIFKDKHIAIVDDILVKGKSLLKINKKLKNMGFDCEVHILACEEDFYTNEILKSEINIKNPYLVMAKHNLYQVSNYITEYIEASMCSYNIDQPIYCLAFNDNKELKEFINYNNVSDITSGLQRNNGIYNGTIGFDSKICKNISDNKIFLNFVYKIRLLYRIEEKIIIALPFVMLGELSKTQIDEIFQQTFTNDIIEFAGNHTDACTYENKYKLIHFYYAMKLMDYFVKNNIRTFKVQRLTRNDYYLFSKKMIFEDNGHNILVNNSNSIDIRDYQENKITDKFLFNNYLAQVYEYVDSINNKLEGYKNCQGNMIEEKTISLSNLVKYLKKRNNLDDLNIVSTIIDIIIDKGIFIPSIVHTKNNSLLRVYKFGEIYQLTVEHFRWFAYMLGLFSININSEIYKTALEKLLVQFFRKLAENHFKKMTKFEEDCYSICFSLFGPRVSSGEPIYGVSSHSVLAAKLEDFNHLQTIKKNINGKDREMYIVKEYHIYKPNDKTLNTLVNKFSYVYGAIYKLFETEDVEGNRQIKNQYIHSFIEYITLKAIGNYSKNKYLALIAELYLLKSYSDDMDKSLYDILLKLHNIMKGIQSGMWKYRCFKNNAVSKIEEDIFNLDFSLSLYEQPDDYNLDVNPIIKKNIDKVGELLFRFAYLYNNACNKYEVRNFFNNNIDLDTNTYYSKKFRPIRKEIEEIVKKSDEKVIKKILTTYISEALAHVDVCNLYLDKTETVYTEIKNLFVISNEDNSPLDESIVLKYLVPINFDKKKTKAFKYIITPFNKKTEKKILSFITTNSSNKALKCICYSTKEWNKSIYYSESISMGRNFENIIFDILSKEKLKPLTNENQIIFYECGDAIINKFRKKYKLVENREENTDNKKRKWRKYVMNKKRFKIAFSFSGEYREQVEETVQYLVDKYNYKKEEILYDRFHTAEFARGNLDTHLQTLYHNESELIVVGLCDSYDKRSWCGIEWHSIRNILNQGNEDKIVLIRYDNGPVKGIFTTTDGYIPAEKYSSEKIAKMIISRYDMLTLTVE